MKQILFVLMIAVFATTLGAAGAIGSREVWLPWVQSDESKKPTDEHPHAVTERIKLSPQARANLRLVTRPLDLQTFRRTIQVPGVVVERRGKGDQSITAPVTGVVKAIHALPGDVVQLGEPLLTLRINSEPLQSSQTELFKTSEEIKITTDQKVRFDKLFKEGTVPESKILDLQYQLDRLAAASRAYRADLALKGLLPDLIDRVEKGEFLKEIVVRVPPLIEGFKSSPAGPAVAGKSSAPLLEVEELKVFPGEQVQAGHLLGYLSNHQNLYIEGRGFREDTPLLETTAAKGWPLRATFHEEKPGGWPPLETPLTILYLANTIDPTSQTFPFYIPLPNQYRDYERAGKKYRIWRYRPGQRVQLGVPVHEYDDVFVLPMAAIVREGAEVYVFRQNGDIFHRIPVQVVHEDSDHVVLANDGSVLPGNYVAHNAAAALNRALKASVEKGGGGGHEGHNHEQPAMLNAIIRFSLRYRMLVVLVSLAVLIYGSYLASTLPIDVFPDLDRPRVVVMTECAGLAPEEVETLVTFPLESALLGATGVQAVRSTSGIGLSVVYVEFDWGTDIRVARQVVQERLTTTQGSMPEGVLPQMAPISSLMGQIMQIGMYLGTGPNGGELAPLSKSNYLAELVHDPDAGRVRLYFWDPRDRNRPESWAAVKLDDLSIRLQCKEPEEPSRLSDVVEVADGAGREITVLLIPDANRQDSFSADDKGLIRKNHPIAFRDLDRRTTVTLSGQSHAIRFAPFLEQQLELRTTADWVVRPRLLKIAGIAQVMVMGGGRKQYQVLVNPTSLLAYDVTLQQVEQALKDNNVNASGGFAIRGGKEQPIRVIGRLGPRPDQVLSDLRQVPVKATAHRVVLLSQLARIVEGAQLKRGDSSVNGFPAVVLTVTKQPHVDTRALTGRVTDALKEVEQSLPAHVVVNAELFQLKGFIDRGIWNVGEALVVGAVLVLIILFLFLLNFRTTFISLTAIPLSLVITALVFKMVGWISGTALSINVMTLGGIAVALGELVDDAIVDVENIFRRLRENHALANPRADLQVIYDASVEIRSAIVFGTIMVIMVFIPLFALSGVEGRLFAPLGVAYIVSILASLLVSLTVTPVLSYYLLPQSTATHRETDSPLLRFMKWAAGFLIRFSMAHPGKILLATWALVGLSIWQLTRLGADFLPPFDEGSIQVNVILPPGSPLEASSELAETIDDHLSGLQKEGLILQFSRRTGRAELDEHAEPVSNSEYILTINPDGHLRREDVIKKVRDELRAELPGVDIEVEQPLQHLISHMLSGVTAQIAIKVHGDDLETLRRIANQIKDAIQDVPGIAPPVVEPQRTIDELHIRVRPDKLALYGVSRKQVAEFVSTALKGEEISEVVDGQRRFDLIVRLDEPYRTDFAAFERLRVELPHGGQVALGELAYVGNASGANQVSRENVRRRIVVRVNAQGRDLAGVVGDIRSRIDQRVRPGMPAGYFVEYGGQFESQRRATVLISVLAVVSFVGMFAVLYMLFPSTRIVLQILNALPTAFIGGVLALTLTNQTLTVASMVGFISLGGIAARNGILLVTHYFHLMRFEGEQFTHGMVLRGSLERLSPVLMTALTAGIGLVPLVVEGHAPGREILYPVATVILGGLITSTLCEFLLHPGIFWQYSGKDAELLAT